MSAGHDVQWAGSWPEPPDDLHLLAKAHGDGRVIVTLDKDFATLAVVLGHPHSGIIRLSGWQAGRHAEVVATLVERYGAELESGAIITASPGQVRIRRP
jgi:predicted nuclease of predicted toxin-antitoxin system